MALASGLDACTGFQTVLPAQRAVVVGGGFIGLEMAENLVHLGLQVTLLQRGTQLLSPMDTEMVHYVERHVARNGVKLVLNADVTEFRQAARGTPAVLTADGKVYPADLVVMELAVEQVAGVVNIPLGELRATGRATARPANWRGLSFRLARLLRHAHPAATWV